MSDAPIQPRPCHAVALALCATMALTGCRAARHAAATREPSKPAAAKPIPTRVVASESRIDAVVGRTLVVPVTLQGPVNPGKPVPVRIDDGRHIEASLYWVSVSPEPGAVEGAWLAPAGKWAATPASAATRPSAAGSWVLMMDLPGDAIGQAVVIGGQRTILNWLPDPSRLQGPGERISWRPPLGIEPLSAYLIRLAEPEALSPLRRWRYKLLTMGLAPEREETLTRSASPLPPTHDAAPFEDPVLEAFARQTESRWQIALAMLWLADADLAERVKRRLVASIDFGSGVVAPAWPPDQPELDALLRDLLNPRLSPQQHAERAAAWLDGLPPAQGWVLDDAGLRDALTGRSIATCGLANLNDRATLAWATAGEMNTSTDLAPLPALGSRLIAIPAPRTPEPEPGAPRVGAVKIKATPATLHAGRWTTVRGLAMDPLDAIPPGLKLGPFVGDWTLAAWLNGIPSEEMAIPPDWATAGMVYQRPPDEPAADPSTEPGNANPGGWYLYLECRIPEADMKSAPVETAYAWLGPTGAPSAILRISSDGKVFDERAAQKGLGGEIARASISREADRWIAQVPVPPYCIEPEGILRVGIQRTDARGRRTAWPRPMLPWMAEPGRIAVSTNAWGSVETAKPASATR